MLPFTDWRSQLTDEPERSDLRAQALIGRPTVVARFPPEGLPLIMLFVVSARCLGCGLV